MGIYSEDGVKVVDFAAKVMTLGVIDQAGVFDSQIGGYHHKSSALQPIEPILQWELNFPLGNVIKYVYRSTKDVNLNKRIEDLQKARHYLEIEIAG
jgi:hypothetical protein